VNINWYHLRSLRWRSIPDCNIAM